MYAVIDLQGHQYIVSSGTTLVVDQLDSPIGSTIQAPVLAVFSADASVVQIGEPRLSTTVVCRIDSHQRAKKIRVLKFKRKNRYERNFGHRSYTTTLTITEIHD